MDMVGEACLPSNAYYPRTPDYTLYSGVHVCWSEHSDSSFVYGFMNSDYGLGTMTTTTTYYIKVGFKGSKLCKYAFVMWIFEAEYFYYIKLGLKKGQNYIGMFS